MENNKQPPQGDMVGSPSLEIVKMQLDGVLANLI